MSHASQDREFAPLDIAVLTVSDSRTEETDKSGKLLADRLQAAGHRLVEKRIVPDDPWLAIDEGERKRFTPVTLA